MNVGVLLKDYNVGSLKASQFGREIPTPNSRGLKRGKRLRMHDVARCFRQLLYVPQRCTDSCWKRIVKSACTLNAQAGVTESTRAANFGEWGQCTNQHKMTNTGHDSFDNLCLLQVQRWQHQKEETQNVVTVCASSSCSFFHKDSTIQTRSSPLQQLIYVKCDI